jgi:hypothetical protein
MNSPFKPLSQKYLQEANRSSPDFIKIPSLYIKKPSPKGNRSASKSPNLRYIVFYANAMASK